MRHEGIAQPADRRTNLSSGVQPGIGTFVGGIGADLPGRNGGVSRFVAAYLSGRLLLEAAALYRMRRCSLDRLLLP